MREEASRPEIDLKAILMARLCDAGLLPEATDFEWLWYHSVSDERLAAGWQEHRDEILTLWVSMHPGTRPSCWWKFDAPRQPAGTWADCFYDGKFAEPRKRVGGSGTPSFEVLAYVPRYEFGMPKDWVGDWDIDYYSAKASGEFPGQRFDRADPPRFESEATYLKRHGLFAPGEAQRLTTTDFKPETLPEEYWPKEDE